MVSRKNPSRFKLRRWRRYLLAATTGLVGSLGGFLAFAYLTAGTIYEYEDTANPTSLPAVDAIVCLAGGRGRINEAARIWHRYWRTHGQRGLPVLYISGMGPNSNWSVLARHTASDVLKVLTPEQVVLETESTNTTENAEWLARYAVEHGWQKVLLITSRYHMRRSRYIFEQVIDSMGENIEIETISVYSDPFEAGEWRNSLHGIQVTMTEYFKYIYYRTFWSP